MKGRSRSVAGERLLASNLLVVGGSVTAGLLGFLFQALISHQLRPADYGAAFAAMTLLTFVGLPASALTLLMARETSRDRARGHGVSSAVLLRSGNRALLVAGIVLALAFAGASRSVGAFFSIPMEFIVAVAASLPSALAFPLLMGEFQGQQRFLLLSALSVGQAVLKLVAAIALGLALGPVGVVLGVGVAGLMSYAVAFWLLRRKLAIRVTVPWIRPALRYLVLIVPSTLALSVLLSADVLLVKHLFSGREAGEYSAVAALGRAIFWGAAGVAAVLFPKVVYHESQGGSGSKIVNASLGLVAIGGVSGLAVLGLVARPVLTTFAGSEYAAGAAFLPLYAIAMTLLGAASVLIATHQSRARARFLLLLLPITAAEPVLILMFHQSLLQVVWVVALSMAALVAGLSILLAGQRTGRTSEDPLSIVTLAEAQA